MSLKWDVPSALFLSVLLVVLLIFLKWDNFVPTSGGSVNLAPVGGVGIQITYETSKGHAETAHVISVPAYRMATPTGVLLQAGDTIEISSSGTVSTASSFNWFSKLPDQPGQPTNESIMEKIQNDTFNRDSDPNWRDSSGYRLSGLADSDFAADSKLQEVHDRWKLYPGGQYGLLLGCILPGLPENPSNLELLREVLKARESKEIFPVGQRYGQKMIVQCLKEDGDKLRLHFPRIDSVTPATDDITIDGSDGYLVLMVNDVLFSKEVMADIKSACNGDQKKLEPFTRPQFVLDHGSELFPKTKQDDFDFDLFIHELWYWDNHGSFSVVIIKKQED